MKCDFDEIDIFQKYGSFEHAFHFSHCSECLQKIPKILPLIQKQLKNAEAKIKKKQKK